MRQLVIVLATTLAVAALSSDALGCSCEPRVMAESPAESKALRKKFYTKEFKGFLFIGKVKEVELVRGIGSWAGGTEKKVTIEVISYWLKVPSKTMIVRTGMNDGDCGVSFNVGKSYVFTPQYWSGALRSGLCDYTYGDFESDGELALELRDVVGEPIAALNSPRSPG